MMTVTVISGRINRSVCGLELDSYARKHFRNIIQAQNVTPL